MAPYWNGCLFWLQLQQVSAQAGVPQVGPAANRTSAEPHRTDIEKNLGKGSHVLKLRSTRRGLKIAAPALLISAALAVSAAPAQACSVTSPATTCSESIVGTLGLTSGSLSFTPPSALGWNGQLTGTEMRVVDGTPADQSFIVNDATGSGAGWNVTATDDGFKCAATVSNGCTLNDPLAAALSINGDPDHYQGTTVPSSACTVSGSGCVAPTTDVDYPRSITGSVTRIFNAVAGTGRGSSTVSNIGWWLKVPASAEVGTYTTNITLAVVSGPGSDT